MTSLAQNWRAPEAEFTGSSPCDALVSASAERLLRAVTVAADPETLLRWVCQLKIVPYSYDLLDNRGRRSPRDFTSGPEKLDVGQRLVFVFTVAGYVEAGQRDVVVGKLGPQPATKW